MANRLLRYEAALFRRSFAAAFGRPRDIALLLAISLLAGLWLLETTAKGAVAALPPESVWLAGLAGLAAFSWQRLLAARLEWLAEQSVLAPDALHPGTRRLYLAVAHFVLAVPLAGAIALLGTGSGRTRLAFLIGAAAYLLGIVLAAARACVTPARRELGRSADAAPPPLGAGAAAVIDAVLCRQTRSRRRPRMAALLIVVSNFLLTAAAAWWGRDGPEAMRMAATVLPSLAALVATARIDSALIGFLPFAGYRPLFIASAVSVLPTLSFVAAGGAVIMLGVPGRPILLVVLALLHILFLLVAIERAWLAPGRDPRSVDLQVQIELGGLIAIALLLPPLAAAAIAWRFWQLYRHNRALLWTVA